MATTVLFVVRTPRQKHIGTVLKIGGPIPSDDVMMMLIEASAYRMLLRSQ